MQQHLELSKRASYGNHYDTPRLASKDEAADHISIKSDDIKYGDTEGQCTSDVKEIEAYKPRPQPKPRHKTKLTATPAAYTAQEMMTINHDVQSSDHHQPRAPVDEGDYTALDVVSHSHVTNDGSNAYQELVVHQPHPPGYAVPNNIPATSIALESYAKLYN